MKKSITIAVMLCVLAAVGCAKGKPKAEDTEQVVDRIVNSDIPVLVDFWAAWCMPCRILDPVIEELEKEYAGRVRFVKVDIDVHGGIAQYFRVQAVPSVFLIEDKTVRVALPGVRDKATYRRALNEVLRLAAERTQSPAGEELCKNC